LRGMGVKMSHGVEGFLKNVTEEKREGEGKEKAVKRGSLTVRSGSVWGRNNFLPK